MVKLYPAGGGGGGPFCYGWQGQATLSCKEPLTSVCFARYFILRQKEKFEK